ncbi:MAG: tRNA (N(6)-L-threonylcarbamoyladenosine(37)-C(2))-methylthiotransferase MtaB [Oscillospiraceae bacterium]|nr:tRNA (N(6)-L-threonylcarbamoyladenosine(37)-C(2))-methylthiotransferase MtaB [Oscillospiraceae bacterium]
MKFASATLGCKVNQYETQAVESLLKERGHSRAEASAADVIIINTCAVTEESERKSKQTIRRLKAQNPKALIAVCGCFSQTAPDKLSGMGADIMFGSADKLIFVSEIERVFNDPTLRGVHHIDDPAKRGSFESLPAGAPLGRTRAVLKIQDGCDNFCSYCIIPFARGRSRSLPFEEAARRAGELSGLGYKEIILTGIEIASYGKDLKTGRGLIDLAEAVAKAAPKARIRLGSLEPAVITEDFCSRLAGIGSVCRHFHLSLQSGCDEILRLMGRKYDTEKFFKSLLLLRKYFPGCAAACDIIVGFPGETEEDHLKTMEFIGRCEFAFMHVFPFSARPGTKAAAMNAELPAAIRKKRAEDVRKAAGEMRDIYLRNRVGETLPVLFEKNAGGVSTGRGDNYCRVKANGSVRRGVVKNVQISGVSGEMLVGVTV